MTPYRTKITPQQDAWNRMAIEGGRRIPDDSEAFDMHEFMRRGARWLPPLADLNICGTTACFLGHYPTFTGEKGKDYENWVEYSDRITGLTDFDAWEWVFSSYWADHPEARTARHAASRLQYLLDVGLPGDWEAQMFGEAPLSYPLLAGPST